MTGDIGRPKVAHEEDILLLLEDLENKDRPVMTPREMSDRLNTSRKTVYRRLETLEQKGVVESYEVDRTRVYWLAEDEEDEEDDQEGGQSDDSKGRSGLFSRMIPPMLAGMLAVALFVLATGEQIDPVAFGAVSLPLILMRWSGVDRRIDRLLAEFETMFERNGWDELLTYSGAKQAFIEDHPAPASPSTLVERLAWADVWAFVPAAVAVAVGTLLYAAQETFGAEAVVTTLGPFGALGVLGLFIGAAYLFAAMQLVGILAQLSLATSGSEANTAATSGSE